MKLSRSLEDKLTEEAPCTAIPQSAAFSDGASFTPSKVEEKSTLVLKTRNINELTSSHSDEMTSTLEHFDSAIFVFGKYLIKKE